jgi:hypothetical protein
MAVALSVAVADRRRAKRFRLREPAEGALRMFPDVVVQRCGDDEWVGVSRQPAAAGEMLLLDVLQSDAATGQSRGRLPVCVIESRPVIVEGNVRHRIRMRSGSMASVWYERQVRRG